MIEPAIGQLCSPATVVNRMRPGTVFALLALLVVIGIAGVIFLIQLLSVS